MDPRRSRYYTFVQPVFHDKKLQTLASLGVSLAVSIIIGVFAIKPSIQKVAQIQKDIEKNQATLSQLKKKNQDLDLAWQNYQSLSQASIDTMNRLIPGRAQVPEVVRAASTISTSNQLDMVGLQFQPIELTSTTSANPKDVKLLDIDFAINLDGSYSQIKTFLDQIVATTRMISIKTVNMIKQEDPKGLLINVSGNSKVLK